MFHVLLCPRGIERHLIHKVRVQRMCTAVLFSGRGAVLFRNLENYSGIKSFKEQAIRRKGPKGRGVRKSRTPWNSRGPSAGLLQAGAAVSE